MKHIAFFITHKTLTEHHCNLTFLSLSKQSKDHRFDKLYIYNTHKDELSNETIMNLYTKYNLSELFIDVAFFDYNEASHKSLGQDVTNIKEFCRIHYDITDRILLLKSDCLLSKHFFDELFKLPPTVPIYFTAPFICAKKRVEDSEILSYIDRNTFVRSDDITFFVEDRYGSPNNDFTHRKGTNVTDYSIKFTSCYVICDFSCHLITNSLFDLLTIQNQTWGGVNLSRLVPHFVETNRCFVVHKYHNIQSENRPSDREGPVETWLLS